MSPLLDVGGGGAKIKTGYKREHINLGCDVDFDIAGPSIWGALVFGYEGWLAGYQMNFETSKSRVTQSNFAVVYRTNEFQLHTNVIRGTEFGGSIYQKVNKKLETAVNLAWTAGNSNICFGIATKYQVDPDAGFLDKVNNSSRISLEYAKASTQSAHRTDRSPGSTCERAQEPQEFPLGPHQEKKSFPKRKVACCSIVPCPFDSPQGPQIPSWNSQGATWPGAPTPTPRGRGASPLLPRGQVLRRDREAPGTPGSAPRLGRQAHLSPAPPPASRWGCSSSSPAWCLLAELALGLARYLARWSPAPGLAAPPGSRPPAGRNTPGAAQRGWGAEATPRHIEATPSAPLPASKSPELPGVAVVVAGDRAGPRGTRAEREGQKGGLQPRWRGVAARPGDRSRPVQDRRAPGGGRRRELRAGAASLRSSSSPPSSPSSSLRRQQVGLTAAAAAQSSSGRAGPSCGLPGRQSPEPLPRDAREAGRARRGARAHTLSRPARLAWPARYGSLAPCRGCGALARPSRASHPKPDRPLNRLRR
ncbi:hypothetical protein NN561_008158 [Cricetulus griseus]